MTSLLCFLHQKSVMLKPKLDILTPVPHWVALISYCSLLYNDDLNFVRAYLNSKKCKFEQ